MSKPIPRHTLRAIPLSILVGTLSVAGCHKADNSAQATSTDPAAVNEASTSGTTDQGQYGPPQQPGTGYAPYSPSSSRQGSEAAPSSMPPPPPEDTPEQGPGAGGTQYADEYAGQGYEGADPSQYAPEYQPVYANEPPPQLPEYEQPPCPGDNYEWTPGYWNYASAGYYWVPGVWVAAPFIGALWTPGYWGYAGGRYAFHHGYWGPHIGYYGGVSYGYGYYGHGYEGGYWNRDHFYYNRSVTRVNNNTRNVYVHNVAVVNNRISYNGGRGGLDVRPMPYELAAAREQHIAPLPAQLQTAREASTNRAQFATANARPQMLAASRPIEVRTQPTPAGLRALDGRTATTNEQYRPQPNVALRGPAQGNRADGLPARAFAPPSAPSQQGQRQARLNSPAAQSNGTPGQGVENRAPNSQQPHTNFERAQPGQPARPTYQAGQPRTDQQQRPEQQARPAYQQPRPEQQQPRPAYQPRAGQQQQPRPEEQQQPRPAYQQPRPEQQQQPRPEQAPRPAPQPERTQPEAQPHPEAPHAAGGEKPHA